MQTKNWLKFTWELGKIEEPEDAPFLPLQRRPAQAEEEPEVLDVLAKSTALDSSLGEAGRSLQHYFTALAPRLFRNKEHRSIAIFHGDRIIGASVFLTGKEEDYHLASGPCVLSEYRSRGLGAWLLQSTLWDLQEAGLTSVSGVCKQHSVLAKYLYPKFGGVAQPCDFSIEAQ
jgi:GNAT superfamily N-acetyltransferase